MIGAAAAVGKHNRAVIYGAGTVKSEMVWELLLIFTDSAARMLAKAIQIIVSGGAVRSDLVCSHAAWAQELYPSISCLTPAWTRRCWVNWGKSGHRGDGHAQCVIPRVVWGFFLLFLAQMWEPQSGCGWCFVPALKSSPLPEGPHRRQLQSVKVALSPFPNKLSCWKCSEARSSRHKAVSWGPPAPPQKWEHVPSLVALCPGGHGVGAPGLG